jgi:hypothetical protein
MHMQEFTVVINKFDAGEKGFKGRSRNEGRGCQVWGTGSASTQLLKACPSQEHFLAIAVMIAVEPFLHYASGVGHGSTTSTPDFDMVDIAVPSYFFFTFRHN